MCERKYLSDVLDIHTLHPGNLNLITAPTGAGKTYFALHELPKLVKRPDRIIYLIDTCAGEEQIVYGNDGAQHYDPFWFSALSPSHVSFLDNKFDIIVMTYAKFGVLIKQDRRFLSSLQMVICDELHNIFWPISATRAQYSKQYPNLSEGQLYDLVAQSNNSKALEALIDLSKSTNCYVIGLTATPRRIRSEFHAPIYEPPFPSADLGYKTLHRKTYRNLQTQLSKLERGKQHLIYIPHIIQMKKVQEFLTERGIRAYALWSTNNSDHPMNEEQLRLREYILRKQEFPPDLDALIVNKSYETSINLNGNIESVIVHTGDEDVVTQARGRIRNDLPYLYVYLQDTEHIELDEIYLNIPLYTEDKEQIAHELNIQNENHRLCKWRTISKLLKAQGYTIVDKKSIRRYSIVTPPAPKCSV